VKHVSDFKLCNLIIYAFAELIHNENKRKFLSQGTNHMSLVQSKG